MNETKTEQKISREMAIGEIVRLHPECIEIMLKYGLHCVGCHANAYETLEQGTMGHGMPEEVFQKMLKEINEAIVETDGKVLTITEKAVNKIKELLAKENKQGHGLRIQLIPGGCSGFKYEFAFDNETTEEDAIIEEQGIKVYIDKESMSFLKGSLIDYIDSLQGSGFKVSNPNAKSTCGCGSSFS